MVIRIFAAVFAVVLCLSATVAFGEVANSQRGLMLKVDLAPVRGDRGLSHESRTQMKVIVARLAAKANADLLAAEEAGVGCTDAATLKFITALEDRNARLDNILAVLESGRRVSGQKVYTQVQLAVNEQDIADLRNVFYKEHKANVRTRYMAAKGLARTRDLHADVVQLRSEFETFKQASEVYSTPALSGGTITTLSVFGGWSSVWMTGIGLGFGTVDHVVDFKFDARFAGPLSAHHEADAMVAVSKCFSRACPYAGGHVTAVIGNGFEHGQTDMRLGANLGTVVGLGGKWGLDVRFGADSGDNSKVLGVTAALGYNF